MGTWGLKANLKGPRGFQGPVGIPGPGAVAADTATAGYVNAPSSETYAAIRRMREPRASMTFGETGGVTYEVVRVRCGGVPIPGLVGKTFANDYETVGTTGANFKPTSEMVSAFRDRTGANIIVNAGGVDVGGMMDSVQIKGGIVYHDFMPSGSARGTDALGFRANGTSKIYSSTAGDTAASLIADGVVDTFAFGPALVVDGVKQTITGTQLSARQIFGVTAEGDLLVISVTGVTNVSGITYPDAADLAFTLGCYNAIALDGGGSVQTMLNGSTSHPSSDTAGPRAVWDFLTINARVSGDIGTSWAPLAMANGFTAHTYAPGVRRLNGVISVRGAAIHATATTATRAATLPWWAAPTFYQRFPATLGLTVGQYYDVNTLGELELTATSTNVAPRYLSVIRYNN